MAAASIAAETPAPRMMPRCNGRLGGSDEESAGSRASGAELLGTAGGDFRSLICAELSGPPQRGQGLDRVLSGREVRIRVPHPSQITTKSIAAPGVFARALHRAISTIQCNQPAFYGEVATR
jgi:hypothetical protein